MYEQAGTAAYRTNATQDTVATSGSKQSEVQGTKTARQEKIEEDDKSKHKRAQRTKLPTMKRRGKSGGNQSNDAANSEVHEATQSRTMHIHHARDFTVEGAGRPEYTSQVSRLRWEPTAERTDRQDPPEHFCRATVHPQQALGSFATAARARPLRELKSAACALTSANGALPQVRHRTNAN